jgi:hypothetical protein
MRWSLGILLLALAGCSPPPAYSPELLQQWNEAKAEGGPTFAGSPAWQAHMDIIESGFTAAGVVDVEKLSVPYRRWWSPDRPMPQQRQLLIAGESLPVASYWAYSGGTPMNGVTAPLIVYNKKLSKADLQDRIVVFQVGPVPEQMASMFKIGHEYATADFVADTPDMYQGISDDQWYQGNYVTRFGRFDEALRDSGAAGAIVIFSMSAERLAGLYTFPLLNLGINGVPGIYVDADTGKTVLQAAEQGTDASLTLIAYEEEVQPYFYTAVLPGRDYPTGQDEQILLVTHSDGPNLSQENGTLGIMALIRHYARIPQSERGKTLRVLLDPQHYSPGRHVFDWYAAHPEIMSKMVASLGVEQLGQLEYGESEEGYGLTGLAEPWQIFVRNDPRLIDVTIKAIETQALPRTEIRVPEKKGQGRWTGLGDVALKHDLAGYATLSSMSGYWGTTNGIESFDATLATQQLDVLVMLVDELM